MDKRSSKGYVHGYNYRMVSDYCWDEFGIALKDKPRKIKCVNPVLESSRRFNTTVLTFESEEDYNKMAKSTFYIDHMAVSFHRYIMKPRIRK